MANPPVFSMFKLFKTVATTADNAHAATHDQLYIQGKDDTGADQNMYVVNTYAEAQVREILDSIGATSALVEARRLCVLLGGTTGHAVVTLETPPGTLVIGPNQANPLAENAAGYYVAVNNFILKLRKDIAKRISGIIEYGGTIADAKKKAESEARENLKSVIEGLRLQHPITSYEKVVENEVRSRTSAHI